MIVTIYNSQTGEISAVISSGSRQMIDLNVKDSESWIEGEYAPESFYIDSGKPVEFPSKPSYPCNFDYTTKSWVWDQGRSWAELRSKRNNLLAKSDWTQVADAPVDAASWSTYRQALRDLPSKTTDPRNPIWPEPPQ